MERPGRTGADVGWRGEKEFFPELTHYYGDVIRQLMIAGVAGILIAAPFYSDSLHTQFPFEISAAIVIAAFAALTNPFKRSIMLIDALLSGGAVVAFGTWAFLGYEPTDPIAFILRDAIALIFLFAFYFSLKTLRAMLLHQVGKPDSLAELRRSAPPRSAEEFIEEELMAEHADASDPLAHEKEAVERFLRHDRLG